MFQLLANNKDGNWAAISTHETKEAAELAKETARQTDKNKWYKIARAIGDNADQPQPTTKSPAATLETPTIQKAAPAQKPTIDQAPAQKPTIDQAAAILEKLANIETSLKTILDKLSALETPTIQNPTIDPPAKTASIELQKPAIKANPKTPKTKKTDTATQFKLTATGIIETEIICNEKNLVKTMQNLKSHAILLQSKIPYKEITTQNVPKFGGGNVTQSFCHPSQHMKLTVQKLA